MRNAVPSILSITMVLVAAAMAAGAEQTGFVRKNFPMANGGRARFVVFVPHNYTRARKVPVILFLHGAGEVKGESGSQPVQVGIGPYIRQHEKTFPFLVVIPQAEVHGWAANKELALGILDRTLNDYNTDRERVYLTGLSMGGSGTWNFAASEPDRWAAIVPICGRTNPDKADQIKQIPCWVFHGAADPAIPVSESREMVAALIAAGSKPRYTEYPKAEHNCWDRAYRTPELWNWLAAQKRPGTPQN